MKAKSALQYSKQAIPVHLMFIAVTGALLLLWINILPIILVAVSVFALVLDVINIIYIRYKAKRDPGYMESKLK